MNSNDQPTRIPFAIFVAIYVVLLGAAAVVFFQSGSPLSPAAIVGITACVLVAAMVLLVPLVMQIEREKNAALDERQRELEALARTVTSSAEQISIAANGLHEIAELAQRTHRQAEQLPHKLQEKIAEFQAQLATAADSEKEELERELLALRTTESERLESVSQRIAKSSAEWAKLEAATQQHLTAANEAVAKLAMGTANAIGKAQASAEQALNQARIEAARSLGETSGNAAREVDAAKAAALAEIGAKLASASAAAAERVGRELETRLAPTLRTLEEKIARLETLATAAAAPAAPHTPVALIDSTVEALASPEAPAPTALDMPPPAPTPKRARKPRREEPVPETASAVATPLETTPTGAAPLEESVSPPPVEPPPPEPAPVPAETIAEIAPVAPVTAEPFAGNLGPGANGSSRHRTSTESTEPQVATREISASAAPALESAAPAAPVAEPEPRETSPAVTVIAEPTPAPRKRPAKKTVPDDEPDLGLELDDSVSREAGTGERVLTSDGATRLIVTAYIGIGNRLFIRGEGPGLSWEKGVPLQFISIGKWRWETAEASHPIQFKLYKNDDVECAALGTQALDPGHQQEVTAAF